MGKLVRSRFKYGTACLCWLCAALFPLIPAAETVMNDATPPNKLWIRRPVNADIATQAAHEQQRKTFRAQSAQAAVPELPSRSALLAPSPPPAALKLVIPNLENVHQVSTIASIAAASRAAANFDRLAYTPMPPRLTPIRPKIDLLAALPTPLSDLARIANAVPPAAAPDPASEPPVALAQNQEVEKAKTKEEAPAAVSYKSPGVIIRKQVVHLTPPPSMQVAEAPKPMQLAELMPAAGADPNAMVPLIPIPEPPTADKPKELPPMPPTIPDQAVSPAPKTPEVIPPAPPIAADQNAAPAATRDYSASALDDLLKNNMNDTSLRVSERPDMLPMITAPEIASSSAKKKGSEKTAVAEKKPAEQSAPTEPSPGLSAESLGVIKKIPSNLEKQKKESGNLTIEHAKDTQYVSKAAADAATAEEETVTHEAKGIKMAVKRGTVNFNYELEKAYNALISGHTEDAVEIYKNVLTNDTNNKLALFGLATTYHRAGQLDMARPLYAKLLALDPKNRDALNNFLVLLADEAPQEALAQMEALEERNPDFSPIPAQMAVIYQKQGNTDKASEKMFKAIALAPENLSYRYNLAIMLDKQHKYDEAAKLYKQIIEAYMRGEVIPGNAQKIQERLTFISSNR